MAVLEVKELVKEYKAKKKNSKARIFRAVDGVTFSVDAGEIVGFLGPNGAGKSTTIKMIAGLAKPTSGDVFINGYSVIQDREKAMAKVGGVIESPDLYLDMTGKNNLLYLASLSPRSSIVENEDETTKGMSKKEIDAARVAEVLKMVKLEDRQNDIVQKYSLGMKQRLGIAQALLCKPQLLILDEPANGLDPEGIRDIRNTLRLLAEECKMAILVSSHQLQEMQLMCDRVLIITDGKLTAERSLSELDTDEEGARLVTIKVDKAQEAAAFLSEKLGGKCEVADGIIKYHTKISTGDLTRELVLNGYNIYGVTEEKIKLEEIFLDATHKEGE